MRALSAMKPRLWVLGIGAAAALLLFIGIGGAAIQSRAGPSNASADAPSTSVPLFPAPTPKVGNAPPGGQLPAVPGPYVAEASAAAAAESMAAQMGSGATRIVSATLETVAQGSASVGSTASSWVGDFVSPDRMVWLLWMQGPYRVFSCPQAPCPAWSSRFYYDVVDATTGALDVTGSLPTGGLPASPSP